MYYTETKDNISFDEVIPGYYVVKDRPNMGVVFTEEGIVVVDTLLKKSLAKQVYAAIREKSDLPIRYLIYTHSHFDHVNAAKEYIEDQTEVIANERVVYNFDQYRMQRHYYQRVSDIQFDGGEGAKIDFDFVYPSICIHDRYNFTLGGKHFLIVNNIGETDDHCYIYIEEDKVLFVGDQCTCSFPNIGTPFRPNRDESAWKRSLEEMLQLDVQILIPGHRDVLCGEKAIKAALQGMIDVLDFLNCKVSNAVDCGMSLRETLKTVQLTPELAQNPLIQEAYGCLDFAVRGIYRRLTGWFDFDPANLEGVGEEEIYSKLMQLQQDPNRLLEETEKCMDCGEYRLAAKLLDVFEKSGCSHPQLQPLKREVYSALAHYAPNRLQQNIYHYYLRQIL